MLISLYYQNVVYGCVVILNRMTVYLPVRDKSITLWSLPQIPNIKKDNSLVDDAIWEYSSK